MPEHYYNHSRRNHRALADPYNTSYYPGLSYPQTPPIGEGGLLPGAGAAVEAAADTALASSPLVEEAATATTKAGGLLGGLGNLGNLANMDQIKGIVDRMGGIEGIMSSMGKVQKIVANFQQMAPMIKLVMGSFGKGKGSSGAQAAEEDAALYTPRRRRKKSTSGGNRRKSKPTGGRRGTATSRKRRRR